MQNTDRRVRDEDPHTFFLRQNANRKRHQQKLRQAQQRTPSGKYVFSKIRDFTTQVKDKINTQFLLWGMVFMDAWSEVQSFYAEQHSHKRNHGLKIHDTEIPQQLNTMIQCMYKQRGELNGNKKPHGQNPKLTECEMLLLENNILLSLVEHAETDSPSGVRVFVMEFFCHVVSLVPLSLLTESPIRLPVFSMLRQSFETVYHSPSAEFGSTTSSSKAVKGVLGNRQSVIGSGYTACPTETGIVLLRHETVQCLWRLLYRLREHSNSASIFFEWGNRWVFQEESGGAGLSNEKSAKDSSVEPEMLVIQIIIEYLLAPGSTGQMARESLILFTQVLMATSDPAAPLKFLIEKVSIASVLIEHLCYLYPRVPLAYPASRNPDSGLFTPLMAPIRQVNTIYRRLATKEHGLNDIPDYVIKNLEPTFISESDMFTRDYSVINSPEYTGPYSMAPLALEGSTRDLRLRRVLSNLSTPIAEIDAMFMCWELIDEILVTSMNEDLCFHFKSAVSSRFIVPNLVTHIKNTSNFVMASTSTIYITELIKCTYSPLLVESMLTTLLGKDISPESHSQDGLIEMKDSLSREDQDMLSSIEDADLRAEAAALLGQDTRNEKGDLGYHLRQVLIQRLNHKDQQLRLATLQLFEGILDTCDQFAYTNLVLHNLPNSEDVTVESDDKVLPGHLIFGHDTFIYDDLDFINQVIYAFANVAPSHISTSFPEAIMMAVFKQQSTGSDPKSPVMGDKYSTSQGKREATVSFPSLEDDPKLPANPNRDDKRPEPTTETKKPRRRRLSYADVLSSGQDNQPNTTDISALDKKSYISSGSTQANPSTNVSLASECEAYLHERLQWQYLVHAYRKNFWVSDGEITAKFRSRNQESNSLAPSETSNGYPGAFVYSLLSQLRNMLDNNMAHNLILTNIVTKLAGINNPRLNKLFFLTDQSSYEVPPDVIEPSNDNSEDQKSNYTLYQVLTAVSSEAYIRSEGIADFSDRLAKQRSLGIDFAISLATPPKTSRSATQSEVAKQTPSGPRSRSESISSQLGVPYAVAAQSPATPSMFSPVYTSPIPSSNPVSGNFEDLTEQLNPKYESRRSKAQGKTKTSTKRFINSFIVLDEFCKELSAIALAHYTLATLSIYEDIDRKMQEKVATSLDQLVMRTKSESSTQSHTFDKNTNKWCFEADLVSSDDEDVNLAKMADRYFPSVDISAPLSPSSASVTGAGPLSPNSNVLDLSIGKGTTRVSKRSQRRKSRRRSSLHKQHPENLINTVLSSSPQKSQNDTINEEVLFRAQSPVHFPERLKENIDTLVAAAEKSPPSLSNDEQLLAESLSSMAIKDVPNDEATSTEEASKKSTSAEFTENNETSKGSKSNRRKSKRKSNIRPDTFQKADHEKPSHKTADTQDMPAAPNDAKKYEGASESQKKSQSKQRRRKSGRKSAGFRAKDEATAKEPTSENQGSTGTKENKSPHKEVQQSKAAKVPASPPPSAFAEPFSKEMSRSAGRPEKATV
ncbi:hypothetical protein H4219_001131 [Mycoemilia scoparia]|uniref:FHF complex subunit HOOK-interacting protein C-terminal domain-containing protein n=1 Tax=Mycoemilia scoparia TaxID=417184 RepID=A0A9W8A1A0_9FUNG|nr:hypothetical protein H4219_001131 [Mycoemilia scoparia]